MFSVGGLDAWLSYIRTRESIWQKYCDRNALFVRANFGCTLHRELVDRLIASTKPLAKYRPEFDMLYECRKLHESLSNINASVFIYFITYLYIFFNCSSMIIMFLIVEQPNIMVIKKDCSNFGK